MNISLPCPPAIPAEELERLKREFTVYWRELSRLLSEGHAGRFVLIREDQVVGVWNDQEGASREGRRLFGLTPITVKEVDPRDVERLGFLEATAPTRSPTAPR